MKRPRIPVWCAVWLLCGGLALAHASTPAPSIRDSAPSKVKNRFSATLRLSDKPETVLRAWSTATTGVLTQAVDRITRGEPIVAFVFFTGCKPDKKGLCNASVDFTIRSPDGSVYATFSGLELWKGKPAPPAGTLRLSAEHVGVVIEPDDPLGEYQFQVSVHDLNAGKSLELKQAFTATENGP